MLNVSFYLFIYFLVKECKAAVDIAFLVDSSGSISRKNFVKMKNFLKTLVNSFDIGPDAAHFAIIAYSTKAKTMLKFSDLRGNQITSEAVIKKIDSLPHQRGLTFIDKALRLAEGEVFNTANGMRKVIVKVNASLFISLSNLPYTKKIMVIVIVSFGKLNVIRC